MGIELKVGKPIPYAPTYTKCVTANAFMELSYTGGAAYADGKDSRGKPTLIRHEQESPEAFRRRKNLSVFPNYCKQIVRRYNNFIYGNSIRRDMTPAFQEWAKDVDLLGHSLHEFMKHAMVQAQKFGKSFFIIDTTKTQEYQTVAQAQAAGNRVFLCDLHPDRVVNHTEVRGVFTEVLVHFPEEAILRLYTASTVQEIKLSRSGNVESVGEPVAHGFGGMPVVRIRAFDDGSSQLHDIAETNKALFNSDSLLREELYKQTFTQQFGVGFKPEDIVPIGVGSRKVLLIPNKGPEEVRFDKLTADVSQAASISAKCTSDIQEIYRLAGLYSFDGDAMGQRASGSSLQIKFNEISLMATSISQQSEKAENKIVEFYNRLTGSAIGNSRYPQADELDATSFAVELDQTLKITNSKLPKVLKDEQVRIFTQVAYPNLTPDKQLELERQIQESPAQESTDEAALVKTMPLPSPVKDK